jgi:hypothetical protein
MVYARKKYVPKKRTYRKRPKTSLAKTIKTVMSRQMETKSRIQVVEPGAPLFHNIPKLIGSNLLSTSQGVDGDGRSGNRIGSSVNPVGIKIYLETSQVSVR